MIGGLEHVCCEERLRVVIVQPQNQKLLVRPPCRLPIPKEGL